MEDRTVYSYIQVCENGLVFCFISILQTQVLNVCFSLYVQSRYYRSPEVVLGYQYPFKEKLIRSPLIILLFIFLIKLLC